MKCPHCNEDLPSKTCPHCSEEVPEESRYCLACGAALVEDALPPDDDDTDDLDLDNRILCPDGTCTGIIENGRCTECGRVYDESGDQDAEAPSQES